jgi:flagellar basal-body rod protein FlgB
MRQVSRKLVQVCQGTGPIRIRGYEEFFMDGALVIPALQVALDGLAQRQRISADNIANIHTPGFRARSVEFESALDQALATDPSADASSLSGAVSTGFTSDPALENGNNVSLERETLLGQETNLRYSLAVRAVDGRFGLVRDALRTS